MNMKFSSWLQYDNVSANPVWQMDAILKIVFGYLYLSATFV